jgi:hypothetical protein
LSTLALIGRTDKHFAARDENALEHKTENGKEGFGERTGRSEVNFTEAHYRAQKYSLVEE